MARIYLDARNITDKPAGVARYAQCLIPELALQAPEHDFVVIRHISNQVPIVPQGNPVNIEEVFIDTPIDNLKNFLGGARALQNIFNRYGRPALYHDLFHILPLNLRIGNYRGLPIVITLHDFVWIDYARQSQPNLWKAATIKAFAYQAIPYSIRSANHVIAVSEPTRQRAGAWIDLKKCTAIYHGVEEKFFEPASFPKAILPQVFDSKEPYIVAVGNDKPYKNLAFLLESFAAMRRKTQIGHLILVGNCSGLSHKIAQLGLSDCVSLPGFLDEYSLRGILSHARVFVFPSLVEGFGLPVLEAMASGAPTIVSDVEPMRTIAGNGAQCVDPKDVQRLASMMHELLVDDSCYESWHQAGMVRAKPFRWHKTAQQTLEVYHRLLG